MINIRLLAALAFGITFSFPVAAKLYKWVDDHGVTHYGETIPPEYADKDRSELNKSGRVVTTKEVPTAEELRTERSNKARLDEEKRKADKAALDSTRHDKMLVNTYSNIEEIDLARDRNLRQIELRINGLNAQIKIISDNLVGLQKEAEGYTKSNRNIPDSLRDDMKTSEVRLKKLQNDLEKPLSEKAALEARFDADKARYKELTGK